MWLAITARHRAICLGLVLLAIALVCMPSAQAQRPASEEMAAKALAVLEKHCASCHQSERTAPAPPKSALRAILDLDALAREPDYVLPGNPDGSRLVQMMMWRHLDPKPPELDSAVEITPEEISAVRAWVKGLPRREPCRVAKPLDSAAIAELAAKAIAKAGVDKAKDMRFVSLAAPYNACGTPQQLAVFRADVAKMLNSLSWTTSLVEPEVIDGSGGALLAVRLADLGWSDAHWTMIVAASPYRWASLPAPLESTVGIKNAIAHGGWLAGALASGSLFESLMQLPPRDSSFAERLGIDIAAARARRIARQADQAASPSDLAISYNRWLDLSRLAAEFGIEPEVLVQKSSAGPSGVALLVARSRQGTVPRREVETAFPELATVASGSMPISGASISRPPGNGVTNGTHPPDIVLLADKPVVQVGDAVSFTVTTNRDCHLTVINVDTLGRGTVIFPNEFEPEGRVAAGRVLQLPPEGAGYEFRARQQGTEALVATCNPVSAWTAGMSHDFERQRFTVLGGYEEFVRKSLAPDAATVSPRPVHRRVQRRGKPPPPPPARPLAGQIGRTGILVEVR